MGLSRSCDYEPDIGVAFYDHVSDYAPLNTARRKRCCSCSSLIDIGALCCKAHRAVFVDDDIKRRIYGDEMALAPVTFAKHAQIYTGLLMSLAIAHVLATIR